MSKKVYLIIALLLLSLTGCNNKEIGDYKVAVIETTSNKEKSLITYYDEDLEKVGSKSFEYAELGSNFYSPEYQDEEIYIVPRGLQGNHNEKKVISLNLKTGNDTVYDVDKVNIICTAVNKKYLFAGSNLNAISYLSRIDLKDKKETDLSFNNEYLSLIAATDKYVFAFLSSTDDQNIYSKINVYNVDSLELIKTIDITEYGINQTKYYLDKDNLYFSNAYDKYDQQNNILGIMNLDDFSLKKVELKYNSPDDIQFLENGDLLISCTDVVQSNGTHVIIYEKDTGNQTSYDLNIPIMNIKAMNNKLYALSSDYNLYVYDIDNDMKLVKSTEHELTEGAYCSNLFVDIE